VLVSESRFAFDKAETLWLYPEVTNLGLWRWVADFTFGVGFGAAAFYRTVALLFAAAYVWIVRWLAARSTVLALSFAALFLSWFGFGQLRYGTALTLLMISIALQGNRPVRSRRSCTLRLPRARCSSSAGCSWLDAASAGRCYL
jgi:hypothetical protein